MNAMFPLMNYEVATGINYEYVYNKSIDDSKPTLLFLHGFPSSLYCWRHQIAYFSKRGFGCLAPNLMGYGKTYSPLNMSEYKTKSMIEHLIALLEHLNLSKVVIVGHDMGVRTATRCVLYHPERTLGLVLFNVGYRPPTKMDLEQVLLVTKQIFGYELFGYWELFNSDDAAKLIEENADRFIDLCYPSDPMLWKTDLAPRGMARKWFEDGRQTTRASYLTDKDYEVMRQYITDGMQPKLNWYKSAIVNIDWEDEKNLDPNIKQPVLYIGGKKDYVCVSQFSASQNEHIACLKSVDLDTCHWTMEENPDNANDIIEKWIQTIV